VVSRGTRTRWLVILIVSVSVSVAGCAFVPDLRPPISEAHAIEIARDAVPERLRDETVIDIRKVRYGEVTNEFAPVLSDAPPTADRWVYWINLGSNPGPLMGQGVFVILDAVTGEVIHISEWVS
jgi:hypothetical protein